MCEYWYLNPTDTSAQQIPIEITVDPEQWGRDEDDDEVATSEGVTKSETSEGGNSQSAKSKVSEGGDSQTSTELESEDTNLNGTKEVEPVSFEMDTERRDPTAELL